MASGKSDPAEPMPRRLWSKWLDESYALSEPPARKKKAARKQAAKKTAARKTKRT